MDFNRLIFDGANLKSISPPITPFSLTKLLKILFASQCLPSFSVSLICHLFTFIFYRKFLEGLTHFPLGSFGSPPPPPPLFVILRFSTTCKALCILQMRNSRTGYSTFILFYFLYEGGVRLLQKGGGFG